MSKSNTNSSLFTSESVSYGHPDKVADAVSDAVLDYILKSSQNSGHSGEGKEPGVRCACETLVSPDKVVVAGEYFLNGQKLNTQALEESIRDAIAGLGYKDNAIPSFNARSLEVFHWMDKQSDEIRDGVNEEAGAGDQGLMFGYAERPQAIGGGDYESNDQVLMPLTARLSRALIAKHTELLEKGDPDHPLRPDAKSQVTLAFKDHAQGEPESIESLVFSSHHRPLEDLYPGCTEESGLKRLRQWIVDNIVRPALPEDLLAGQSDESLRSLINRAGRFQSGGPEADAGLTGRKIIVDTYGGVARHGGGAFSGKDPTKVDRSAAYAARWVAKSIVAARLAQRCEVQLSYAIGHKSPLGIHVETFGTAAPGYTNEDLQCVIQENFNLEPLSIRKDLELWKPRYLDTAMYGHFGRPELPWETVRELSL